MPLPTFTAGRKLRASEAAALESAPGVVASRGASQSIPNNAFTDLTFPTEEFDNMSGFTANGSTITVSDAGVYMVSAGATWATNATGTRAFIILANGVEITGGGDEKPGTSGTVRHSISAHVVLAAGGTVKVQVYQASGGALNIVGARLSAVRVSG